MHKSVLIVILTLLMPSLLAQREKPGNTEGESYTAVAVGTRGGAAGKTLNLEIAIGRYTTDKELGDLLWILREEGQESVRRKLEKVELGRIVPEGVTGTAVSVARAFELNDEKVIRLLTIRPILESYQDGRHPDYPFTIVEIRLDEKGSGEGFAQGGTKIQFDNGLLQFESSGDRYALLTDVRAVD